MSSISEKSFGARLQKAYDLLTYVLSFLGFAPPREKDKPENLEILLDGIKVKNADVAQGNKAYTEAVSHRQDLFTSSPTSMKKLLSPILNAVVAQFGKKSVEYKMIAAIVKKIRASRVEKAPKPDDPDAKEKVSKSTRSYGSLTQLFNDIVTNLKQLPAYKPVNASITTEALEVLSTSLFESNKAVASTFGVRTKIIAERLAMYADLTDRVGRIKAHTKSHYGVSSNEYTLIKGLQI